jgi:hypothetical protein
MTSRTIASVCKEVLIITHKEDTQLLVQALLADGFQCRNISGPYTKEEETYSSVVQCFVNHKNAWLHAADSNCPVIILEPDFVPVRGFGQLPLPFPWHEGSHEPRIGWLYSSGSILYGIDKNGYPYGHGNTTVAYIISSQTAKELLRFFEQDMARDDRGDYRAWDTYMGPYLRWKCGILNYIPIYQYGEHGGRINPAHRQMDAMFGGVHRADLLWGRLAFLPLYAEQSRLKYLWGRTIGLVRGWGRVVLLRFYDPRCINADTDRGKVYMAAVSIARMLGVAHFFCPLPRRIKS